MRERFWAVMTWIDKHLVAVWLVTFALLVADFYLQVRS